MGFSPWQMLQIWTDREVAPLSKDISSQIEVPMTNIRAADSPIIRPMLNKTAVKIPGIALGKITLNTVCVLDARLGLT